MSSKAPLGLRALTSWRVLVVVVVIVILTVTVGTVAIREQIRVKTLDGTVDGVSVLSSVVIDRILTLTDITDGLNPAHRAELNADVVMLKRRGSVAAVAIWSLADGRLVYSDIDPPHDGTPSSDVIRRAREGRPFVAPEGEGGPANTVTIYYPYDANGDGTIDAVAEVVLPRTEVDESIAASTRLLYAGGALVLLLAVSGIMLVRRRQISQEHAASHDALTGLGNRALLRHAAPPVLAGGTPEAPATLLLIDLDEFKAVNDTFGHHAGDELLISVAHVIERESAPAGIAVRLGGDEFAVLMPSSPGADIPGADIPVDVATRIRDAVRRPQLIAGLEVEVDASIGVARAPVDGRDLDSLLRRADMAMYGAKHSGGGVVDRSELPGVTPIAPAASTWSQFGGALEAGQLEMYYQPEQAADGTVHSIDAQARWHHPERGPIDATALIPPVTHTSFMLRLTDWALRQSAQQCARLRAEGVDVTVSINVRSRSLFSKSLVELMTTIVAEYSLPLSALELDVPEAVLVAEPNRTIRAMQFLRDAGIRVNLDNVGAEFGAVSAIATCPIHRAKIDRRLTENTADPAMTEAIVGLVRVAHRRNVEVVALGVDAPDQWRRLVDIGCDAGQGEAICPALPASELSLWLTGLTPVSGTAGRDR